MDVAYFTDKSKEAISIASNLAIKNNNPEISDCHMVTALLDDKGGVINMLFKKMDINTDSLLKMLEEEIAKMPKVSGNVSLRFSVPAEKALEEAEKQAKSMKDQFISVEHLMLGILEHSTEALRKILKSYKIDKHKFLVALKDIRGNVNANSETPEDTYDVLSKFGKNVTDLAKQNKLNPVIGRDDEIRNVIRILSRKTKNNPVLIGEPGVGKTAIVEGLAQRIV